MDDRFTINDEHVSSQITLEAIMKSEMNSLRWAEEPRAVGKRAFSHWGKTRDAKVTGERSFVRCKVRERSYSSLRK